MIPTSLPRRVRLALFAADALNLARAAVSEVRSYLADPHAECRAHAVELQREISALRADLAQVEVSTTEERERLEKIEHAAKAVSAWWTRGREDGFHVLNDLAKATGDMEAS